jgi:hypothetical protein
MFRNEVHSSKCQWHWLIEKDEISRSHFRGKETAPQSQIGIRFGLQLPSRAMAAGVKTDIGQLRSVIPLEGIFHEKFRRIFRFIDHSIVIVWEWVVYAHV